MAQDDLYLEFLKKLKAEKSEAEIADYLANLMKYGGAMLFTAMFYFLNDEDLKAIEQIKDKTQQEEEIRKRFKDRTGMTTVEFLQNLRDSIAKDQMFPALQTSSSK